MPEFMIRIEEKTERAEADSYLAFGALIMELRALINDAGFDFICTGLSTDVINAWIAEQELSSNLIKGDL